MQSRRRDVHPTVHALAIRPLPDALQRVVDGAQLGGLAFVQRLGQIALAVDLRPVPALDVVGIRGRLGAANLAATLGPNLGDQLGAHLLQLLGEGVRDGLAHGILVSVYVAPRTDAGIVATFRAPHQWGWCRV